MKCLFVLILSSAMLLSDAVAQQMERHCEVRIFLPQHHLRYLSEEGMSFDHGHYDEFDQSFSTILAASEVEQLDALGYPYSVQIEDVTQHFLENNTIPSRQEAMEKVPGIDCNQISFPVPEAFPYPGSMGGYITFAELEEALDSMHASYPNLMSPKQSIGVTHEGRNIWMFKVSDNPVLDEGEPEILYSGMHHAREPMSIAVPLYFACYLMENYSLDERIRNAVDHTELYFVPCINPDGYVYNQTIAPNGGGLWRKNRKPNGDGTFGVDLNRNYGYEWGYNNSGSSPNTNSSTYRGDSAFSELESQAMKALCESREFRIAFNHHSYSELLLKVFGYATVDPPPADNFIYDALGNDFVQHNTYDMGSGLATLGYFANGNSDDWMYGEQTTKDKIFAYTPEIGTTFWPSATQIIPLCVENMYTCLRAAYLVGNYADLQDWSSPNVPASAGTFPFRIRRTGLEDSLGFTISLIPLENIASAGPPVSSGVLGYQQTFDGSISYNLVPGLPAGSTVRFVWELNNGKYTTRDTVTKFYLPDVLLEDACEDFNNWMTTSTWSITTAESFNGSACITDSDGGSYLPSTGSTRSLFLMTSLDLSSASSAKLTFWTKYNTVLGEDYVQVAASKSGPGIQTDYEPLCGIASRPGTQKDLPAGEPTYHGIESDWVKEEVDLDAFIGEATVGLRFQLNLNSGLPDDGFYIDDVSVVAQPAMPCACAVPSGLSANSNSCSSVTLNWDPIPCVDGYTMRGRLAGNSNWVVFDVPDNAASGFYSNVLECNTAYEWQIRSVCDSTINATSAWSAVQSFSTTDCTAPDTNFVSNLTANSVTLNWDTVPCAAGYRIQGGLTGSGTTASIIVPGGGISSYTISGLACNSSYQWRVGSICFCQGYVFSEATASQQFNTLACPPAANLLSGLMQPLNDLPRFKIFPNPAKEVALVQVPETYGAMLRLKLYDVNGRSVEVTHTLLGNRSATVDVRHLSNGIYFLLIETASGGMGWLRLIKA